MTEKKWREAVRDRDGHCSAQKHDPRCRLVGHHAHHIVYRSHLTKAAMFVVENGVWLSLFCHDYAHRVHNANISADRCLEAVEAVNAIMPHELRRPHFKHVLEAA